MVAAAVGQTQRRWRVHVTQAIDAAAVDHLREHAAVTCGWGPDAVDLDTVVEEIEGLLIRTAPFTADHFVRARHLRVVSRFGVGFDNVDVDAATRHGIPLLITADANARSVAEHVLGLVVVAYRGITSWDRKVREGRFDEREAGLGRDVTGRVLGVIGVGRIGQEVARIATAGFGMRVKAYHPTLDDSELRARGFEPLGSLGELLATSDVVTLHVPLTPATRGLIGRHELSQMRADAVLVNVSRGGIVDEAALAEALRTGRLLAAAVDVYEQEPPPADHPLFACERAILTPHNAAHTKEAFERMAWDAVNGLLDGLAGRRPANIVNPQVWPEPSTPRSVS